MTTHVSRAEWGARPPKSVSHNITPSSTTGHWEGAGKSTARVDHANCAEIVRGIQAFHMNTRGWADIAYSGMACHHGYFYEGRGPGVRTAANGTNEGNQNSYAICALIVNGDIPSEELKAAMTHGAAWLGQPLTKTHNQWKRTACPGPELTTWIYGGGGGAPTPPPKPPTTTAPPFPFPSGHWMGVKSSNPKNHSGYYVADRPGIQQYQQRMKDRGWTIGVDGLFGSQSQSVTKKFQAEKGLTADGLVGLNTWNAAWVLPTT